MCEINPKRKYIVQLEFYTAHEMTDERWNQLTLERILQIEQEFNKTGEIRVHVHELD